MGRTRRMLDLLDRPLRDLRISYTHPERVAGAPA
jgi:hypothetical protein